VNWAQAVKRTAKSRSWWIRGPLSRPSHINQRSQSTERERPGILFLQHFILW